MEIPGLLRQDESVPARRGCDSAPQRSRPEAARPEPPAPATMRARGQERTRTSNEIAASFDDRFVELFDAHFQRIFRVLDRLSGEPELATDLAQDAFVRLYRRGSVPDKPEAWLIAVAMNLFRNAKSSRRRRRRLLTDARAERVHSDASPSPAFATEATSSRRRVRIALDSLPERERSMLLLRAEGYSYRDIAEVLRLNETSVGTLLARARTAFRTAYENARDAP